MTRARIKYVMTQHEIQTACHQFGLARSQVVKGYGWLNTDEPQVLVVTSEQAAKAVQAAIAEYYDMTIEQFCRAEDTLTDGHGHISKFGRFWKVTC